MENSTTKITYQFTAVPTNLFLLLDNNCRSMLFTLIQLSSHYAESDGYFFRSNTDLQSESNLSKNLVIVAIDTLYNNGIIDVNCVGKSKGKIANYYKVNFDKLREYEKFSIDETKNPKNKIETLKYKNSDYSPSYLKTAKSEHKEQVAIDTAIDTAMITAIDTAKSEHNIDSIDNIENKDNIYNKENNIIIKENSIIKEEIKVINADAHNSLNNNNEVVESLNNVDTNVLSNVDISDKGMNVSIEIMPKNESKQANVLMESIVTLPTNEEIQERVLSDINLYFNPTYYNGKGLRWYEVINTMQHHANEIRDYIKKNVSDIEIKNNTLPIINAICDDACEEIRSKHTTEEAA